MCVPSGELTTAAWILGHRRITCGAGLSLWLRAHDGMRPLVPAHAAYHIYEVGGDG